jgi:hypothetical protein
MALAAWGVRPAAPAFADEKAPAAVDVKSGVALLEAAKAAYEAYHKRRQVEPAASDPEYQYRWSRRWLEAERALADSKEKRLAAYRAHLERMQALAALQKQLVVNRFASKLELAAVGFYRIEAEQWLAEAKRQ